MNYQLVFKAPAPKPEPTPRLLELRATLEGMCVESEWSFHQHHRWTPQGVCERCNTKAQLPKP